MTSEGSFIGDFVLGLQLTKGTEVPFAVLSLRAVDYKMSPRSRALVAAGNAS